ELKGLPSLSEKKVLAGALSSTSSLGWRVLGTAAHSPGQIVPNLPSDVLAPPEDSVPWESRTMAWWLLHRKQHLVQTLLYGPDNQVVIDTCTGNDSDCRVPQGQ
ncbi:hypothetical protein EI555_008609, partial [Monodon monoceros]